MKLEQLGLVAAVRGLCKELGHNQGLPIDFSHADLPEAIPPDVALCLYRIAQEALRNVVKHSGAASAIVALHVQGSSICLEVRDNGNGFDSAAVTGQGGLGLVSMRERLRLVEGELVIESTRAVGTRLEARVPLCASDSANIESIPSAVSR
jgi:signal transduction histidine kinase